MLSLQVRCLRLLEQDQLELLVLDEPVRLPHQWERQLDQAQLWCLQRLRAVPVPVVCQPFEGVRQGRFPLHRRLADRERVELDSLPERSESLDAEDWPLPPLQRLSW